MDGLPAEFVRMGVLPSNCEYGPNFENRKYHTEYCGFLHEHRLKALETLKNIGINVQIRKKFKTYGGYLNYLNNLKIFIYDESTSPLICNGEEISRSTFGWIKPVEIAARGTFCIKDFHKECEGYNISKFNLIRTYKSLDEVPEIINEIESIRPNLRRIMQKENVDLIREQYDWFNTAHTLVTGHNNLDY